MVRSLMAGVRGIVAMPLSPTKTIKYEGERVAVEETAGGRITLHISHPHLAPHTSHLIPFTFPSWYLIEN